MPENKQMNKDQEIANAIMGILGRTQVPIYCGSELQVAVDINQWLERIVKAETVLTTESNVEEIKKTKSIKS